jgi:hypothetical protein
MVELDCQREGVGNSDLASDFEAGPGRRKIPNAAVDAAGVIESDAAALQRPMALGLSSLVEAGIRRLGNFRFHIDPPSIPGSVAQICAARILAAPIYPAVNALRKTRRVGSGFANQPLARARAVCPKGRAFYLQFTEGSARAGINCGINKKAAHARPDRKPMMNFSTTLLNWLGANSVVWGVPAQNWMLIAGAGLALYIVGLVIADRRHSH